MEIVVVATVVRPGDEAALTGLDPVPSARIPKRAKRAIPASTMGIYRTREAGAGGRTCRPLNINLAGPEGIGDKRTGEKR
jgi:hypothetical protein